MHVKTIAVVNHKGGVGKTTTTLNLGKALSLLSQKVLIVDIDPQANLSQSLKIEDPERSVYHSITERSAVPIQEVTDDLHIVPASLDLSSAEVKLIAEVNGYFRLKEGLDDVQDNYDFILIDCPPSLGILTINALIAASEVIIVVQSQYLAIKGLSTVMDLIEELRKNLNNRLKVMGLLLTQINRTVVSKSIVESVQGNYQNEVFQTQIRQNVALVEASTVGQDIFDYDETSNAAQDYMSLAKEILNK